MSDPVYVQAGIQAGFDPVAKIAAVLERTTKKDYAAFLEASPATKAAGLYLGHDLEGKQVVAALAAKPEEEVVMKLVLANLAKQIGDREPNLKFKGGYVARSTCGAYVGAHLDEFVDAAFFSVPTYEVDTSEQTTVLEPYQDAFHRYLGINPDVKLVADDLAPLLERVNHRLPMVSEFSELVYLAGACIYAGQMKSDSIRTMADSILDGDLMVPRDLFHSVALLYAQDIVEDLRGTDVSRKFSKSVRAEMVAEQADQILDLECTLECPQAALLAYEIDQTIGKSRDRVLVSSDGLHLGVMLKLVSAGTMEGLQELRESIGLRQEEAQELMHRMRNSSYRGIEPDSPDSVRQFITFLDELPGRLVTAPWYDPEDRSFAVGDKVVPYEPSRVFKYLHGDKDFTPDSFPLGTVSDVTRVEGDKVYVRREGDPKEYAFDREEIAKVKGSDSTDLVRASGPDLVNDALRLILEPEVAAIRVKSGFMFHPSRYQGALRYGIYNLLTTGLSVEQIKERVDVKGRGLLKYFDGDPVLQEWVPGSDVRGEPVGALPEAPLERVTEIFSRFPGLVEYSKLRGGGEADRAVMYHLMIDSHPEVADGYFKLEHSVMRYVLGMLAVGLSNDSDRLVSQAQYSDKDLKHILTDCAICVYQSLVGAKGDEPHRGMSEAVAAGMTGDVSKSAIAEVLETQEALREQYPRSDSSSSLLLDGGLQVSKGGIIIFGDDPRELDRKRLMRDVEYDPAVLEGFKLFQGLKEGLDVRAAAERYMELIPGYEEFALSASSVHHLRHLLGYSVYGNMMGARDEIRDLNARGLSPEEVFVESVLMFVSKAAAGSFESLELKVKK